MLFLTYASARRRRFRSAPLLHIMVLLWRPLRARHGTNMSQFSHLGWGRFPSSQMMSVSRTCLLQKCTRIAVSSLPSPGTLRLGSPLSPPWGTPSYMFAALPLLPLPWSRPSMPISYPLPFRVESCGGSRAPPPPSIFHSPRMSLFPSSSPWASVRPPS